MTPDRLKSSPMAASLVRSRSARHDLSARRHGPRPPPRNFHWAACSTINTTSYSHIFSWYSTVRTVSKSLWLNFMLSLKLFCLARTFFFFQIRKILIVERTSWSTRLLLPLTAGDFGGHCWGFHVTGWDESLPPSRLVSGGPATTFPGPMSPSCRHW